MTRGLQPGDLVIVAARPSMGKTSLVLNIAEHAAIKHGQTVGFFSLEMSREQLFIRLLTSVARIDAHRLHDRVTSDSATTTRLSQAIGALERCEDLHRRHARRDVLEMRAKARRLAAEHGLNLLVIDYLQLMTGRGRFENRTLELAAISRGAEGAGQGAERPGRGPLAAQSRAGEPFRPSAAALGPARIGRPRAGRRRRAHAVPRRHVSGREEPEDQGNAELIIAKQRNGPTGTVELAFLSSTRGSRIWPGRSYIVVASPVVRSW